MLKPEHATPTDIERVEKSRLVDMNFKLDIGHVLLAGGFAVTIVAYLVTDHNSINHLTETFSVYQIHNDKRLDDIANSITNLPVDREMAKQEASALADLKLQIITVNNKVDDVKQSTNDKINSLQTSFIERLNEIQLKGLRQPR